ncbi:MAG: hypothetical protein WBA74_22070, partial [Cyclobacteriaceae bacterium]
MRFIGKGSIICFWCLGFIFLFNSQCYAQFQEGDYEYTKEVTWGINKNTNGGVIGGLAFKLGLARSENVYEIYGLELS